MNRAAVVCYLCKVAECLPRHQVCDGCNNPREAQVSEKPKHQTQARVVLHAVTDERADVVVREIDAVRFIGQDLNHRVTTLVIWGYSDTEARELVRQGFKRWNTGRIDEAKD